jgi:hypothetical protein
MKKAFLGYVLALICAGIYMRVAANNHSKAAYQALQITHQG